MKRQWLIIIYFICIYFYSFAANIEIPDFETQIEQTGNFVPDEAVPVLKTPASVPIPVMPLVEPEKKQELLEIINVDKEILDTNELSNIYIATAPSTIQGSLEMSLGLFQSLAVQAHIEKQENHNEDFPFSFGIWWKNQDFLNTTKKRHRYGHENLGFSFEIPYKDSDYNVLNIGYTEKKDGSKVLEPGFIGTKKHNFFLDSFPIQLNNIGLFGEKKYNFVCGLETGTMFYSMESFVKTNALPLYTDTNNSYFLKPSLKLNWYTNNFYTEIFGHYFYESTIKNTAFMYAELGALQTYNLNVLDLDVQASFLYDSAHGPLIPFKILAAMGHKEFPQKGEPTNFYAHFGGGLDAFLMDKTYIFEKETFSSPNILTTHGADWVLGFNGELYDSSGISLQAGLQYRKTALHRPYYTVSGNLLPNGLAEISKNPRDVIHGAVKLGFNTDQSILSAGYDGFLFDKSRINPTHIIFTEITVFGKDNPSFWELHGSAQFYFSRITIPVLSLEAKLLPFSNVSIVFSFEDMLSLFLEKVKTRNSLYTDTQADMRLKACIRF